MKIIAPMRKPVSHRRDPSFGNQKRTKIFSKNSDFFLKSIDISKCPWYKSLCKMHLGVAQLVARYLGVVEAASSSLVTQTRKRES